MNAYFFSALNHFSFVLSLRSILPRVAMLLCFMAGLPLSSRAASVPTVISVTPANGATQVPATSSVTIVFDQAMDRTVTLFQGNASVAGTFALTAPGFNQPVVGTWAADGKSLTLKPALQFPYATFTWTLNPTGPLVVIRIRSQAGVELPTVSGTFTTGAGGTDANLGSSIPANGAVNVRVDRPVEFKFDQVMKKDAVVAGTVLWSGVGLDVSNFGYSWSTDGRSLFATYATNLPAHTQISWQLNPSSASVKLQSAAGKPLAVDSYAGQFTTGSSNPGCDLTGLPSGWGSYSIYKRSGFQQFSSADPLPGTNVAAFVFSAAVLGSQSGGSVASGSITLPNATVDPLVVLGGVAQFSQFASTEAALNSAFPAGVYTLRFKQGTNAESVVAMTLNATQPPVPKIQNFTQAQSINAAADFTLQWGGFTGAGADDHISLLIGDGLGNVVFQAPDPCAPRDLATSATSIVIPAGTLQPNQTYSGSLSFMHLFYLSTNSIPNMAGYGQQLRETTFNVSTAGNSVAAAATLSAYRVLPNGNPQFTITGTASRTYVIQRTHVLPAQSWTNVGNVTLDSAGHAIYEDTQAGKVFPLYYRVVTQ